MVYVTNVKAGLKMAQLDSPWPTYGGRPTTLWVYLVPFGSYTWERAYLPCPCLRTAVLFAENLFDHVTKPMVLGHSPPWATFGHIFVFLRNIILWLDILADKRHVTNNNKNKKNLGKNIFFERGLVHGREIFRVDPAFMAAHVSP